MRTIEFYLAIAIFFGSCQPKERVEQLKSENDALRKKLASHNETKKSFDRFSQVLHEFPIIQGEGSENSDGGRGVPEKLSALHEFLKSQQQRLTKLEHQLHAAKNESEAYLMLVDAMRSEVEIRDREIQILAESVALIIDEKKKLSESIFVKDDILEDLKLQASAREKQLTEVKILVEQQKNSEAELCYRQAQLLENAAYKIKFSPMRKRDTLKEALELYRKSHKLGKTEAFEKITLLEQKTSGSLAVILP